MPNKIDPNKVTLSYLPQNVQTLLSQLHDLTALIIESNATHRGKEDALRIIETFKFIAVNPEWIAQAFTEEKDAVYQNERDKKNGVLRDHVGTAFHLNAYSDITTALISLNRMIEQFITAMESLRNSRYLASFINSCTEVDVGCLEARVSPALMFYIKIQNGIPDFPTFMNEQLLPYQLSNLSYTALLLKLKTATWRYLGELYGHNEKIFELNWECLANYLRRDVFLINDDDEEAQSFTLCFSPIQNYFDYLRFSNATVRMGQFGMLQHRFKSHKEAQHFKQWLCGLACLENEKDLAFAKIRQEEADYVIRLTHTQLKKIEASTPALKSVSINQWIAKPCQIFPNPVLVSPIEIRAEDCSNDEFYAKTITGFRNQNAWSSVIRGVTLRSKLEKPDFRNPIVKPNTPFRLRLNPTKHHLEIHKRGEETQSLFRDEKNARKAKGQIPLPPHQSFTYYDPKNPLFKPHFFSPTCLSIQAKQEVIGIRIAKKDGLINRILSEDSGTYNLFYGFPTEQDAKTYLKHQTQKEWPLSLEQLKTVRNSNKFNEVMVRAQWCCDGSSQILIYPPYDSLAGRYKAILYARDLEKHLATNQQIYCQPPICWHKDYKVPIAFYRNDGKSHIYYYHEQEEDLQKSAKTPREFWLKVAITYLSTQQIDPSHIDVKKIIEELLTAPENWIESIQLLDFISYDMRRLYSILIQLILDEGKQLLEQSEDDTTLQRLLQISTLKTGAPSLFVWAIENNLIDVIHALIEATNQLSQHEKVATLKKMLLAGSRRYGPAYTFKVASQNGQVDLIKTMVEATKYLPETERINTLQQMLLAENPRFGAAYAFQIASIGGHTEVVKATIEMTNLLPKDTKIATLKQMLLAGSSFEGAALAFKYASKYGHNDVVKALLDATNHLPGSEKNDTLKQMLLSGTSPEGAAVAFKGACKFGHFQVVKTIIEATNKLPEAEKIAILTRILLEERPEHGAPYAFKIASQNGHVNVIDILIEATDNLPETQRIATMKKMLLGDGHAYAFKMASKNNDRMVITTLFNTVVHLPETDMHETLNRLIKHAPNSINQWIKIDADKPQSIYKFLLKSNLDHRQYLLSQVSKNLNFIQQERLRQYIICKLVIVPDMSTIKKEYNDHARFFSRMAMRNEQNPLGKIQKDSESNINGASTLTLLGLLDLQNGILQKSATTPYALKI